MKINKNMGQADRVIRMGVSIILLILGLFVNPWILVPAFALAITAYFKYCPLYSLFKINTLNNKFQKN